MTVTAYDEVEARSQLWRERMARAYASWCGSRWPNADDVVRRDRSTFSREANPFADDAYTVLGCISSDSDDVLIAAYRRMAKRFHPDHAVASETLRATDAMSRINAAWDRIRRSRQI